MNEEQALVAAVRADPNDNTRRLAFADWLDEHDQPQRAAWVRDVEIFWWMGPDYVSPLPQILKQLRHVRPIERDKAGPVVERLRGAAAPMLREAFAAGNERLRGRIAELFSWVRDGTPRPLPELIADVRGGDENISRIAVVELGWHSCEAVPALIEAWERWTSKEFGDDVPMHVIEQIALALERHGPAAIDAIPALLAASRISDRIGDTVWGVMSAMGSDAIPAVRRLLDDPNEWVRYHAAVYLSAKGVPASEVSPVVRDLRNCGDRTLRSMARNWLRSHGFPAR